MPRSTANSDEYTVEFYAGRSTTANGDANVYTIEYYAGRNTSLSGYTR
ncbi:MAG: hypothetical protein HN348_13470 [Proteobacteria bacterium]|nr:hypothetical protein [Pseudomonadota bacterium]